MVWEDLKPSDILTREAFENTIVVNSAIGGSTNAPIHINAIARHIGVPLSIQDWETIGHKVPLLVNMQPAGKYLGEEYHRAGGVPAVVHELMKRKLIHEKALTVNGKTMGENCAKIHSDDPDVIMPIDKPLKEDAGFVVLSGNLFNDAIMKTSVIDAEFRARFLSNPKDPDAFEGRGDRVRRARGLSPPHRRSEAQDRRAQHSVHSRHGPHRLSGRGGSGEHAAAGGAPQKGRARAAPALAMVDNRAPPARRRSSTLRLRPRREGDWR